MGGTLGGTPAGGLPGGAARVVDGGAVRERVLGAFRALDPRDRGHVAGGAAALALRALGVAFDADSRGGREALRFFRARGGGAGRFAYEAFADAAAAAWRGKAAARGDLVGAAAAGRGVGLQLSGLLGALRGAAGGGGVEEVVVGALEGAAGGRVSALEFREGLRRAGVEGAAEWSVADLRRLFRSFDDAADGKVDYEEFAAYLAGDTLLGGGVGGGGGGGGGDGGGVGVWGWGKDGVGDGGWGKGGGKGERGVERGGKGWGGVDGWGAGHYDGDAFDDDPSDAAPPSAAEGELFSREVAVLSKLRRQVERLCPTAEERRRLRRYLISLDGASRGFLPYGRFAKFLRSSGLSDCLDEQRDLTVLRAVLQKDDDARRIDYERFCGLLLDRPGPSAPAPPPLPPSPAAAEAHAASYSLRAVYESVAGAVARSAAEGTPFHAVFSLSDPYSSGLMSPKAACHCLRLLGCRALGPAHFQLLFDQLPARADGLVDYALLYKTIAAHAPLLGAPAARGLLATAPAAPHGARPAGAAAAALGASLPPARSPSTAAPPRRTRGSSGSPSRRSGGGCATRCSASARGGAARSTSCGRSSGATGAAAATRARPRSSRRSRRSCGCCRRSRSRSASCSCGASARTRRRCAAPAPAW